MNVLNPYTFSCIFKFNPMFLNDLISTHFVILLETTVILVMKKDRFKT